jgi:hypothetical protein
LLSNPNGRSHFSGCPAKTLRQNALANSDDIRAGSIDDAGLEWCQAVFVCKALHLHTLFSMSNRSTKALADESPD